MIKPLLHIPVFFILVGCFNNVIKDEDLEKISHKKVNAEKILVLNNSGTITVKITGQDAFRLDEEKRIQATKSIALIALKKYPDAKEVLFAFVKTEYEVEKLIYAWENNNGKLSLYPQ